MKLHELKPNKGATHRKKRVGRGTGSGHGKTSTRGEKGQTSRAGDSKVPARFEGGQTPFIMRIPKRGFINPNKKEYEIVNLSSIESKFNDGDEVTPEKLVEKSLVKKGICVKILANGDITKKLTVKANAFSSSAKSKIEATGGSVEVIE
ncbi:MAG: 50S ribosomal protein L15 [Hydrogenothermaceae bacterium]|nr:50S ribosomal protein L15 [Hydrogenothermaceae bacterium]